MEQLLKAIIEASPFLLAALVAWLGVITNRQQNSERERKLFMDGVEEERKEFKKALERIDELEKSNTVIASKYREDTAELNLRITTNSEQLTKVEGALSQANVLIAEISAERDRAKQELDLTNQKLVNTRQQLETKLNEVETALNNLKGDYDLMTKTYNDLQDERKRVEQAFQDRVSKLESDLLTAETRLAELETKLANTEKERDDLQQKNVQLEAEQVRLNQRVSELETERDGLQRQVDELRTELTELRARAPESADNKPTDTPPDAALSITED